MSKQRYKELTPKEAHPDVKGTFHSQIDLHSLCIFRKLGGLSTKSKVVQILFKDRLFVLNILLLINLGIYVSIALLFLIVLGGTGTTHSRTHFCLS